MDLALVLIVVVVALAFDFTNGFHDAANAIATAVSTRALTPRMALLLAAVMNFAGAFLGQNVAKTIASDVLYVDSSNTRATLVIVLAALAGAIVWNLITWWKGLPSSSSHALIGGLAGAGLAAHLEGLHTYSVKWGHVAEKVFIPMIASPVIGFTLAFFAMLAVLWLFKGANPHKTFRRFRQGQVLSSAAMALGHGLQDAQKTMGVLFMASVAMEWLDPGDPIPIWIQAVAAAAISLGTYSGGWRIMRTLGRKVIELDPARGVVAETVGASVLYLAAYSFGAPVSTTHTITAAIMGVGSTQRLSAVRWGMAGNIVGAWLLTFPMAGLAAGGFHALFSWIVRLLG